jgi:DNA polymerase elongation subunit (family B)
MDLSTLSKEELLKLKKEAEYKVSEYKNLQLALKVQLNSSYGALGSPYFRFYDLRQAEAITLSGQASITFINQKLNEYLNNILKTKDVDYVIANDTDSTYLNMEDLVNKITANKNLSIQQKVDFVDKLSSEKIEPYIDKCFEDFSQYMNSYQRTIKMKREAIADKGLWTGKKRYILSVHNSEGVAFKDPQIKITGIESVRSSTPDIVRKKIQECITIIMKGEQDELHKFIENFEKEFEKMSIEEIGRPVGANNLLKYSDNRSVFKKGTPQQVKGALIYNYLIKKMSLEKKYPLINEGEKIKTIYLLEPNNCATNCISFIDVLPKEFDLVNKIDYETQFEKTFLKPMKNILDAIGWTHEKVSTLEDLFY